MTLILRSMCCFFTQMSFLILQPAAEVFGELERCRGVMALDLLLERVTTSAADLGSSCDSDFSSTTTDYYRISVPEVTLAAVKPAALDLLSTADDNDHGVEMVQPERLLHSVPKTEAEAQRLIMMAVRRLRATTA